MILFIWAPNWNFTAALSCFSSNMALLLSFLFALLATYIVDFDGQRSARLKEIHQGNVTASIWRVFKSLSSLEYANIFRSFYGGGGSGGGDDDGPPFYTPGRWNFLPFMDSNSLLFYDLQWQPKEKLMLFPKQWYEDEELVYTWNSIMKGNGITRFDKVSVCPCRWILNYCMCCLISVFLTH